MEQVILIMSLYEKLVEANSKLDAGIVIEQMKEKIKKMRHPKEKKILRPFDIYFDDPSLIAAYARRNVPPTHDGPGIQESLFGRYKHNYTNQDKLSNKQIDQVLFKHFTFRQMMVHRFVEDFQNGKKDKGIEEAKMRYKSVQGRINLDHENPEDTVEEISPEHLVRKSPRKRKKTVNLSLTPATKKVKKMLISQDADMNEPYDTSKGSISPGFCQFSKNKNVRKIQYAQLKKTYHKEIAAENQKLEEKKKIETTGSNNCRRQKHRRFKC